MTDLIAAWRTGLQTLDTNTAPCPGLRSWSQVRSRMLSFMTDGHAETAAGLGWTTLDLFGVHRTVGSNRADCTGALLLGHVIDEIQASRIRMGNVTYYRKEPHQEAVALWDYREPTRRGRLH